MLPGDVTTKGSTPCFFIKPITVKFCTEKCHMLIDTVVHVCNKSCITVAHDSRDYAISFIKLFCDKHKNLKNWLNCELWKI